MNNNYLVINKLNDIQVLLLDIDIYYYDSHWKSSINIWNIQISISLNIQLYSKENYHYEIKIQNKIIYYLICYRIDYLTYLLFTTFLNN